MADIDPFADAAFVSRLQKLLSLLGSGQPAEAEAARRKLLDHLAGHRLSLTDVAQRLPFGGQGGGRAPNGGASFTQGALEMGLERQLSIARLARQDAELDARRAMVRIAELQLALRDASADVASTLQSQGRVRLVASAGWLAAGILGALGIGQHLHTLGMAQEGMAQGGALAVSGDHPVRPEVAAPSDQVLRLTPGERFGTVLVQDLAVRLSPSEEAGVRAFLNRGMRVVVEQQVRVGGAQSWLLIRSVTGSGWVRGEDVMR